MVNYHSIVGVLRVLYRRRAHCRIICCIMVLNCSTATTIMPSLTLRDTFARRCMFACVHSTKCVITTEQEVKNTLLLIHFCLIQSCSPQGHRKHFKCNCLRCCLTKAAAAAAGFLDDINKLLQVITSAGKGKCRCAEKFIFGHVTLICCLMTLQMFTWFFSSRYPNTEWNRSVQFSCACATEPIFLSSHYFERHRRAFTVHFSFRCCWL